MLRVLILEPNKIEELAFKYNFERLSDFGIPVEILSSSEGCKVVNLSLVNISLIDISEIALAEELRYKFPMSIIIGVLYQRLHKGFKSIPEPFDGLILRESLSPFILLPWTKLAIERADSKLNSKIYPLDGATRALKEASNDLNKISDQKIDKSIQIP